MTPETNSYSLLIRDGLLDRIKLLPKFSEVARFGRSSAQVVQSEHIPYLGCYLVEEELTPDGDANAGEPRFIHEVKLGFSYLIQNNDSDLAEDELDAGHWAIMNMLRAQNWHYFGMGQYEGPDDAEVRIESITHGSRAHMFGNVGRDNETPVAEMRMEWTVRYRTVWPPIVTDDLETVHVETVPMTEANTVPPAEEVQRISSQYDLETE